MNDQHFKEDVDEQADTLKGLTLALHNRMNEADGSDYYHNFESIHAAQDLMEFQGLGKPTF